MSKFRYKGYNIDNKSRLNRLRDEYNNPYGYNLDSNLKETINYDYIVTHPNQNFVKNKEYLGKQ